MEKSQTQDAKFIRQGIWKNHALKRTFTILPVFNISTFDICSTASVVRHAYWNSDSSLWFQSAMYPAANPDPPLLAAVAAFDLCPGRAGTGSPALGSRSDGWGGSAAPLAPQQAPSPALRPAGGQGTGGTARDGGCLPPQRSAPSGNPGQYFF